MNVRKLSLVLTFSCFCLINGNLSKSTKPLGIFATAIKYAEDHGIFKSRRNLSIGNIEDPTNGTTQIPVYVTATPAPRRTDLFIPDYYNKLEVPALSTRAVFQNLKLEWDERLEDTIVPLEIEVGVLIRNIRDIDEVEGQITVVVDFVTKWLDPVIFLANTNLDEFDFSPSKTTRKTKSLDPEFINRLWRPDLFVENVAAISRTQILLDPVKFLFGGDGIIVLSARINIKIDCDMEFRYYPADIQHCVFKIRSYSHTRDEVCLKWRTGVPGAFLLDRKESNFDVQISSLRQYVVNEPFTVLNANESELYDVLEFTLSTRRKLSLHLLQTYIPSLFFIIISWLCFLMTSKWVEVKIAACMTTLLTMTSLFSSVREHSPQVSYIKSLDIWMVGSIFFVFLNLFLFIVVLWLRSIVKSHTSSKAEIEKGGVIRKLVDNLKKKNDAVGYMSGQQIHRSYFHPQSTVIEISKDENEKEILDEFMNFKLQLADKIEKYSFLASFLLFLIFNAVYWYFLFKNSKYFEWEVNDVNNAKD